MRKQAKQAAAHFGVGDEAKAAFGRLAGFDPTGWVMGELVRALVSMNALDEQVTLGDAGTVVAAGAEGVFLRWCQYGKASQLGRRSSEYPETPEFYIRRATLVENAAYRLGGWRAVQVLPL